MDIEIKFRDGTSKSFPHVGRAGGSYTKEVRYEGNFCIIKNEWHKEIAYPMDLIKEVIVNPDRY